MDRGARPPDVSADTSIFGRDRRRTRRHRVHTPAYASLTGSAQGAGLELSEILDISETGMCIQSSSLMKVNRLLPLCLDLSETGARIHVIGHVVWSEAVELTLLGGHRWRKPRNQRQNQAHRRATHRW